MSYFSVAFAYLKKKDNLIVIFFASSFLNYFHWFHSRKFWCCVATRSPCWNRNFVLNTQGKKHIPLTSCHLKGLINLFFISIFKVFSNLCCTMCTFPPFFQYHFVHYYTICLWSTNNYPKPAPFLHIYGKVITKSSCWNPWPPRLSVLNLLQTWLGDCLQCRGPGKGASSLGEMETTWEALNSFVHWGGRKKEMDPWLSKRRLIYLHHQGTREVCRLQVYVMHMICHVSHGTWQNTIQKKEFEVAAFWSGPHLGP